MKKLKIKISFFNKKEGRFSLVDFSVKRAAYERYIYFFNKIKNEDFTIIDIYDYEID